MGSLDGLHGQITGINASGAFVGWAYDDDNGVRAVFRAVQGGPLEDIQTLTLAISIRATVVNEAHGPAATTRDEPPLRYAHDTAPAASGPRRARRRLGAPRRLLHVRA